VHTYEAAPRRINESRRGVVPSLFAGILVVIAGLAGSLVSRSAGPSADTSTVVGSLPSVSRVRVSDALAPPLIDCGGLHKPECNDAIEAARNVLGDVPYSVVDIRVWAVTVCNMYGDCPQFVPPTADAVGTVVMTFEDRAIAWINVSYVLNDRSDGMHAKVMRWVRVH
jgi:hypothetical protein